MGVHWALRVCDEEGIDAEILDLRTLLPLDYEAIAAAVRKTNRVIVLHEDTLTGGVGGEIAAWISEHQFEHLDAPVMRSAGLDTPVPFAVPLEQNYMPVERFRAQVKKLAAW
jgi:2-oxoisovalerate dehydrogenase E1 component